MIFFKFLFWPWNNVHQMAFISLIILIYNIAWFGFHLISPNLDFLLCFNKKRKISFIRKRIGPKGNSTGPIRSGSDPIRFPIGQPLALPPPLSHWRPGPTARSRLPIAPLLPFFLPLPKLAGADPIRSDLPLPFLSLAPEPLYK